MSSLVGFLEVTCRLAVWAYMSMLTSELSLRATSCGEVLSWEVVSDITEMSK